TCGQRNESRADRNLPHYVLRNQSSSLRRSIPDLAASFQAAVVEALVTKTERAAQAYGVTAVHLAGGVSANSGLRQAMKEQLSIPVRFPPLILCTDNAAMIGAAAHWHFVAGKHNELDLDVIPSLQLV
ncbi:MAG: tRNA (adenosine(37)-N6)-threonylcarbamoyltransferase complex transferase subunit TsaD, partial [Anaerolineae bacterium]|nr:tRNA (adenosine(37)-N6)-threonylcarbamoyltransferase complex transferase subunit TsaD [Anaerolineae bacterium]